MGVSETLKHFNWVDILAVALLFRACYIGFRQGIIVEFFKLLGVLFASFFALHYYWRLGTFLSELAPVANVACNAFSYLVLISLSIVLFLLFRKSIFTVIHIEVADLLKSFGGLLLGSLRGVLAASLVFIFFNVTEGPYLAASLRHSRIGSSVVKAAPFTYKFMLEGIFSKFSSQIKLNRELFNALEEK